MRSNNLLDKLDIYKALFGLFFAFGNRLQTAGDAFYKEITCKQFFLLACISLFTEEAPTTQELADVMGSSHQNVKQILVKLKARGYINIKTDSEDRRKLRIFLTDKTNEFAQYYEQEKEFIKRLYDGIDEKQLWETFHVLSKIEDNLINMKITK